MTQKACKNCKAIYEGTKCPSCESTESSTDFKGKVSVINPEQSEIAQHLQIKKQGFFALRLG